VQHRAVSSLWLSTASELAVLAWGSPVAFSRGWRVYGLGPACTQHLIEVAADFDQVLARLIGALHHPFEQGTAQLVLSVISRHPG